MTTERRAARDWIWEATEELNHGNFDAAIETLTMGISWYPNEAGLYRLRAEVYRRMNRHDKAGNDEAKAATAVRRNTFKPGYQMARDMAARSTTNDSLFAFDGTLGRLDYFKHWMYSNAIAIGGIFFGIFLPLLGGLFAFLGVIAILAAVVLALWISLASATKRLKDLERNEALAWLIIVPVVNNMLWIYLLFAKGRN